VEEVFRSLEPEKRERLLTRKEASRGIYSSVCIFEKSENKSFSATEAMRKKKRGWETSVRGE